MISTKICFILLIILKSRAPRYFIKLTDINLNIQGSEVITHNIVRFKIISSIIKFNLRKIFEKIKFTIEVGIKFIVITAVIQNKNFKTIFKNLCYKFLKLCQTSINHNHFKFVYINNEQYNYDLVEYMCSYKKTDKFSILDFCSVIGISIPHFCYHPDLAIAGNCRMCLIQLEGSQKPIASCALTISNKMIINTQSIFVKKLQEVF
jgi:hypothetical protein